MRALGVPLLLLLLLAVAAAVAGACDALER